jgi:hypothetical protein
MAGAHRKSQCDGDAFAKYPASLRRSGRLSWRVRRSQLLRLQQELPPPTPAAALSAGRVSPPAASSGAPPAAYRRTVAAATPNARAAKSAKQPINHIPPALAPLVRPSAGAHALTINPTPTTAADVATGARTLLPRVSAARVRASNAPMGGTASLATKLSAPVLRARVRVPLKPCRSASISRKGSAGFSVEVAQPYLAG